MNKVELKKTKSIQEAFREIERLEALFLKTHKRKSNIELVIFSIGWRETARHGIEAKFENGHESELEFYKQNV